MTPAFATLFNPPEAASLAIARLRETAIQLQTEGMRGKELRTDEWVTIVQIERVLPEAPPPGRIAPLLRAASRVAQRAADLLAKDTLTTGDLHSLETAADWAKAAQVMLSSYSSETYADSDVAGTDQWLAFLVKTQLALINALSGNLSQAELDELDSTDPDKIDAARTLDATPPMSYQVLFTRIDAQRWSRLLWHVHADIRLSLRERDTVIPDWAIDSRSQIIRCDTDGLAAMDELSLDPLLYASRWDLPRLAERLAAGVEVVL